MDALAAVAPVIHRPVPDMREDSAGLRDASELLRQLCPVPFLLELTKRVKAPTVASPSFGQRLQRCPRKGSKLAGLFSFSSSQADAS